MAFISGERAGGEALVRFLDMVAFAEGTSTSPLTQNDGYDVIVTGVDGPETFTDYSKHPFVGRMAKVIRRVPLLASTASGRYQILFRFWDAYRKQLNLSDFSPLSQDLVALQQIKERGVIASILAGDIEDAIAECSNIWASLPGNAYGQPQRTVAELVNRFNQTESA